MIEVTGHRGAKKILPENTLLSFRYAMDIGCDIIELDIHRSKDGKLVVIHDETLERTTNGRGKVSDKTLKELKQLDAGNGNTIPTLEEVIELVKDSKIKLQIELKGLGTEELVANLIKKYVFTDRVIFTSFWHKRVSKIKELLPRVKTGILISCNPVNPVQLLSSANADNLHVNHLRIDKDIVREIHESNKKIIAWGEIMDKAVIDRLIEYRVDAIGSDHPNIVIECLKKAGLR